MKDAGRIWAGIVLIGFAYGISHDLITAHLWPPYFTVHHYYFGVDSPIVLALIWGIIATWPSFFAGGLLAGASLGFRFPKADPKWVLKRAALLSAICWIVSLSFIPGIWIITRNLQMKQRPPDWDERSIAVGVAMAHQMSYTTTFVAILVLILWTLVFRAKADRADKTAKPD